MLSAIIASSGVLSLAQAPAADALGVSASDGFTNGNTPYATQIIADHPTAYWRLDDASGLAVADSSGAGYAGQIVGSVTQGVPGALTGEANPAMYFDGVSGEIQLNRGLPIGPNVSIEAWVKAAKADASGHIVAIRSQAKGYTLSLARQRFSVAADSATSAAMQSPPSIVSTWHHLVVTNQQEGGLKLYVDGALAASAATPRPYDRFTGQVALAAGDPRNASRFAGSIDEVAIYPSSLSAARVRAHYLAGHGQTETNPGPARIDPASAQPATTRPVGVQPGAPAPRSAARVRAFNADAGSGCGASLQQQIDAAPAGSTISAPSCVYRESVTIAKPLTLVAQPGAEIRGSDVWSNWSRSGSVWMGGALPALDNAFTAGCLPVNPNCNWGEQVYRDGQPLVQVGANPASGQWAADPSGQLQLADDPTGHLIEVSTRTIWVHVVADNVIIQGFTMQHAANSANTGALLSDGVNNLTVRENTLAYAHGANLALRFGGGHKILNNDIHHAGQLGVLGYQISDSLIQGNWIHENNFSQYATIWESGGVKLATSLRVTIDGNEVWANLAHGLWCDLSCQNITYSNNRVHDNADMGIVFELSTTAKIYANRVWNNALRDGGGWGCDIFVSSSSDVDVAYNIVLATGTHGILVASQQRPENPNGAFVNHTFIHDNVVVMNGLWADLIGRTGIGWFQDWSGPILEPNSNNRGWNNAFSFSYPEESWERFGWNNQKTLAGFAATQGGAGSTRYMSVGERDQVLAAAGMPPLR